MLFYHKIGNKSNITYPPDDNLLIMDRRIRHNDNKRYYIG